MGNYGGFKVQGFDFLVNYWVVIGFGGVDVGFFGNYQLKCELQSGVGVLVIDELYFNFIYGMDVIFCFQMQVVVGVDIGNFCVQVIFNYIEGYGFVCCIGVLQDGVKDFNIVNLFFKYEVLSDSMLFCDLEFMFNINNVFDQDLLFLVWMNGVQNNGFINGFIVGCLVQFGVFKKF